MSNEYVSLKTSISQDLHDFCCHGHMDLPSSNGESREKLFKDKLKRISEIENMRAKQWQKERGYGADIT